MRRAENARLPFEAGPSGDVVEIQTPEGKPTDTREPACAICDEPMPLRWVQETRASGRALVYPEIHSWALVTGGFIAHVACAPAESQ